MRIVIETDSSEPQRLVYAADEPAEIPIDGGAPAALTGGEGQAGLLEQAAASAMRSEDAGPPATALVAAIQQAYEQDPGRYDVAAADVVEPADGGPAPA